MLPTPDTIEQYIRSHAIPASIARADEYQARLDAVSPYGAIYRCVGKRTSYTVAIHYSKTLKTECSCPYDHEGICKHSVAALRAFARYLREQDTPAPPPVPATPMATKSASTNAAATASSPASTTGAFAANKNLNTAARTTP